MMRPEYDAEQDSEESFIRYYFFRGFEYKEIILLLLKNHGIEMSLRTLKRRIKSYGLRRQQLEYNIDQVRASVPTIIDGHGSLQGYYFASRRLTQSTVLNSSFIELSLGVVALKVQWSHSSSD